MSGLKCGFCKRGKEVENDCGELHHVEETKKHKSCTAHHKCMQYSALLVQYKSDYFGGFKVKKVLEEQKRGRCAKCAICMLKAKKSKKSIAVTGATAGCALKQCKKSFHFFCAKKSEECLTKRLVVSFKSSQTETILYRVFCSAEHQKIYRANLKQYMSSKTGESDDSDQSGEEEEDDDDHDDDDEEDDEDDKSTEESIKSNNSKENNINTDDDEGIKPVASNITDSSYIDMSSFSIIQSPHSPKKPIRNLKRCSTMFGEESVSKKPKELTSRNSPVDETMERNMNQLNNKHVSFSKISPTSESNTKPSMNDTESKHSNYALCILSTTQNMEQQRQEITGLITSSHNSIDRIIIWQDISPDMLNKDLTPYFILAISKELRSTKTLNRLLFSEKYLKEKRDADYQYQSNFIEDLKDPEVAKNVLQSTWKTVSANLIKISEDIGELVGELVNTSYGGNVLILYLTDATDKNYTIRSDLPAESQIFLWNDNSSICHISNGWFHKAEVDILTKYLNTYKEAISHVILQPEDILLRKTPNSPSVVSHLVEKYKDVNSSTKNAATCLILLSELDTHVVKCSSYILKMLDHIVTTEKPKFSSFLALLPVCDLPMSFRFQEEIPKFLKSKVDIKVFSAANPIKKEISCVLVELKKIPVKQTTYVKDEQKPSTSGTSRNKRLRPNLSPSALACQQNSHL